MAKVPAHWSDFPLKPVPRNFWPLAVYSDPFCPLDWNFVSVPYRLVQGQQVHWTLTSRSNWCDKMYMYLCCLFFMHVMITCSRMWVWRLGNPRPSTQILDSQAKHWPWEECECALNSPIYRIGRHSQSTENMGTRWTNSHQHQQYTSSSSMSVSSNINAKK